MARNKVQHMITVFGKAATFIGYFDKMLSELYCLLAYDID